MPLRVRSFSQVHERFSEVLNSKPLLDMGRNVSYRKGDLSEENIYLEKPDGGLLSRAWLCWWSCSIRCGVQKPVEKVHTDSFASGCQIKIGKQINFRKWC